MKSNKSKMSSAVGTSSHAKSVRLQISLHFISDMMWYHMRPPFGADLISPLIWRKIFHEYTILRSFDCVLYWYKDIEEDSIHEITDK